MAELLDDILGRLEALPEKARQQIEDDTLAATGHMKWIPSPGPQTDAFFCEADVLLYGGSGGAGKSDLGLGLAFTEHSRSLIIRRKYANLSSLTERACEINGTRNGFNASPPPLMRTDDGRYIQFAGSQHLGDEQDWQGHAFDLKVFDEATQFLEAQVRFHLGWLRSTDPTQRVRAILPTNPPINADGDWIIGMFRPWLDITHHNPAEGGELRWYVTAPDGEELEIDEKDLGTNAAGRPVVRVVDVDLEAVSRSFIPAKLKDNPYLIDTGYQAQLDALPEPLRSAVRDGNFMATRADAEFQVIPTDWVIAAQERWTPRPPEDTAMTAMAVDPAGGGADAQEMICRYGGWYSKPTTEVGEHTKDGNKASALIFELRRDDCPVVVDVGGGYGGQITMRLADNGVTAVGFDGGGGSLAHTKDGQLSFANKRAEAWWKFREELDPSQEGGSAIALPPDPEARADLTAPTWKLGARGIVIESKIDLRKRLGRSPGKGDVIVMALSEGNLAVQRARSLRNRPNVVLGHSSAKRRR